MMKNYRKKIEILKDDIIDDIIKITQKKGKHFGHQYFIIVENNNVFRAVRYCEDLDFTWRKFDDYKHLSFELGKVNKGYVIDSKEGEVHSSHFDARNIDVDTLSYILETIKKL